SHGKQETDEEFDANL
nr:RecName: Full=Cytochrome c oxidase subunit 5A, mitochondrial; AltName: Full=Cytochrome c oxidase polypeptide Va [Scyliorhinus canicula]